MADRPKTPPAQGSAADAGNGEFAHGNLRAELLARMGHELRTPLNAIIGFIRLVEDGLYSSEEERRDYLASARQSALALLDLINNILDLARIEAGRLALDSTELSLAELVEEVAKTLAPEAHAKGVEIDVLVDPALPARLKGDPVRLRQVLYNLAGNAVKFTDAGYVLLRAELEDSGQQGARIRCTVRDTGIGVPVEQQPTLFQSFLHARRPNPDRPGGIGLGLSICKQLVEQMGGHIGMESRRQAGSTFWFTVTLPRGRTRGPRPQARTPELEGAPILLLNPDAAIAALQREKLGALGVALHGSARAEEALEHLAAAQAAGTPVRIVLVDHHLSRDEALVFARRLRREARQFQPDLVYLSIIGSAGDVAALREAGFTGFVAKPATMEALRNALASLLTQQGRTGATASAAPAPRRLEGPTLSTGDPRATILVAEDNVVNQKLIHALLTKAGYATRLVGNGRDAIEALRDKAFDLVLMDVQMPVLDGLSAARAIRQLPRGSAMPIIAMTADALDGDRERCLAAGMDDYLPKPIMPDVLREKLARWLNRADGAEGSAERSDELAVGEPQLDLAHLDAVRDYARGHDPARFARWLDVFRTEARAALESLAQAEARQDWLAAQAAATRLALASGGFGAPRLHTLANRTAERAAAGAGAAVEDLISRLEAALQGVNAELAQRYGDARATSSTPPAAG